MVHFPKLSCRCRWIEIPFWPPSFFGTRSDNSCNYSTEGQIKGRRLQVRQITDITHNTQPHQPCLQNVVCQNFPYTGAMVHRYRHGQQAAQRQRHQEGVWEPPFQHGLRWLTRGSETCHGTPGLDCIKRALTFFLIVLQSRIHSALTNRKQKNLKQYKSVFCFCLMLTQTHSSKQVHTHTHTDPNYTDFKIKK